MRACIHRLPGIVLIDHEFDVPLDYTRSDGDKIRIFGREVVACDKEKKDLLIDNTKGKVEPDNSMSVL
jgi:hypothetical protein